MSLYRAFVGLWDEDGDHEWTKFDEAGLTWLEARDRLMQQLSTALDDDEPWRSEAAAVIKLLENAPHDQPFESSFEGEDYLIKPDDSEPR